MNTQLEKVFFIYILNNKKYFGLVKSHFFKNPEIKFIYTIIREYMLGSSDVKIPSPKQMWAMISLKDNENTITKEILKNILQTKLEDYSEMDFIVPKFNAWILSNRLKSAASDIVEETRNLDNDISDFDTASISANKIKEIVNEMTSTKFIQDDDLGSDFNDPETHIQDSAKYKIQSGFPTIDHMLGGGWDVGTLNMIMGETNSGKCYISDTELVIRHYLKESFNSNLINNEYIKAESFFSRIKKGHEDI